MSASIISYSSMLAIPVYVGAALLMLGASHCGYRLGRPRLDLYWWFSLAAIILLLLALRLLDVEELVRDLMRQATLRAKIYDGRRTAQAAAVLLIGLLCIMGFWFALRFNRRFCSGSRRRYAWRAGLSLCAFLPLYCLRIVSFHTVDAILYAGPIRLNWLLELGALAFAAANAVFYIRSCRDGVQQKGINA